MRTLLLLLLPLALAAQTPAPEPVREDGLYATITTSMGAITVKLFEKEAPETVRNFMGLAMGGRAWTDPKTRRRTTRPMYPGTIFHRVIPGFMIQGGDPTGTGDGGTDVIIDEFVPSLNFDVPGRLAMANANEPKTGSCQFFITEIATPHLNQKHTIFGQVVENQELVGKIARVPRGAVKENMPNEPVKLVSITFERWSGGQKTPVTPKAAPAKKAPAKAVKK